MKKNNFFNDKVAIRYIFLLSLIFLTIVPLLRFIYGINTIIGQESYYHLRIAEEIIYEGLPVYDELSGSDYILNPLHLFLAFFVLIAGEKATAIFFPFILGVLSMIFYIKLLKKFRSTAINKFLICFIIISSPIFIYTFSTINSFALPIFLNLFGLYLFTNESKISFYLSVLIFSLIPFFGFFNFLLTTFLLLSYSYFEKKKFKNFYFTIFILLIISLFYYTPFVYPFFFPKEILLNWGIVTELFFEFGAMTGFSIFIVLLSIIGFFDLWKQEEMRTGLSIFSFLFVFSFFTSNLVFYLNFAVPILAAYGLILLIKMRWKIKLIKNLTLLILILAIIISSISSIFLVYNSQPDISTVKSLEWMKINSEDNGKVLSYFTNSFWIQKIAGKKTLTDPILKNSNRYNDIFNVSKYIFYSRNIEITTNLINKYNITYIFIDYNMKNGLVWKKPDQGLLFLLDNSEIFKKIYDRNDIEIWSFNQSKNKAS